ncbi:hypothetical protein L211DRAFT_851752 [Terfezia boudieri ATCC MYA-4762]|uniref:ARS-binding protein 1 N-terminal domain-containing protein n=1 Tax=Terfezia boudieri ATCC MYA-4762 TaxID=1051890 RepID=A0A3N4LE46_9PEZI|nr:hypothetical protein L211DRAFT_851752 [Terfezia boudieri ATCC MYA-4762]
MPNSHGSPHVPQRQAWSESERQAIRTYAAENSGTTWRFIKRWFEAQNPNKELTQSQISNILNPKRPRGPSDVDPVQVQKLRPDSKRIRTGRYTEFIPVATVNAKKWSAGLPEHPPPLPDVSLLFVCIVYYLLCHSAGFPTYSTKKVDVIGGYFNVSLQFGFISECARQLYFSGVA